MTSTSDIRRKSDFLKYSRTIGIAAMEGRGYYYPVDSAIGAENRLYVLSRSHETQKSSRVTACDLESEEFFSTFGSHGEGDGQFIWPTAIAVDGGGQVYVSDEYTHRISIFDPSGGYLGKWGEHGNGLGELDGPAGMAFDGEGNLLISDHRNNRVQRFTTDGRFLSSFGTEGAGDGQFKLPWGVTVDRKGEVYVADWRNDRIQRFTPDGEFISSYGTSGRGNGQFNRPSGVAVDGEGYVYVADWRNERVQVLDHEGGFVTMVRGQATESKWANEYLSSNVEEAAARSKSDLEPKIELLDQDTHQESAIIEKYFWAPVSVKLDKAGRLYVTESHRHRVQVYQRAW